MKLFSLALAAIASSSSGWVEHDVHYLNDVKYYTETDSIHRMDSTTVQVKVKQVYGSGNLYVGLYRFNCFLKEYQNGPGKLFDKDGKLISGGNYWSQWQSVYPSSAEDVLLTYVCAPKKPV